MKKESPRLPVSQSPHLPVSLSHCLQTLALLTLALIQPSCVSVDTLFGQGRTVNGKPAIVVDISEKKALVKGKVYPVVTGRAGIGGSPGSGKTPLSTPEKPLVVIAKYANTPKGLGPSLHIGGVSADGYAQARREILFHRTPRAATGGCVGFAYADMPRIYASVPIGTPVIIQR